MSQAEPAAVAADAVSFTYPHGIEAIAELTLQIRAGEFVAVMGTNGSGKTTLLKLLMRLLTPQRGQVRLAGSDIRCLRAEELYRQVGLVFQNPVDQLFAASVEQDVAFGPRNQGLSEAVVTERVDAALEAVEALELRQRPVHQLSYGQQKRVCLAGVLAMQPRVLLLDEPTGGLDPVGEAHMIELLVRLNREQKITIILSTHAVDLLPVLADRIYVLRRGSVWQAGTPHAVLADPQTAAQAGLRIPLVSQLFHDLRQRHGLAAEPLPLTIEDARRQILQWLTDGVPLRPRPGDLA
ncbi:MAG: ATP-binding cassette domain-containing protein [Planctomycetota bacterium]|nr:ATP-binding cassette domain-containing protein [Planctomycetota bacterium]